MTARVQTRIDGAQDGQANMAADRELLRRAESERRSDSLWLRIYSWSPPTISLGFHQNELELDTATMRQAGVPWVRRPTGGGAILHDQECTFALATGLPRTTTRDIRPLYEWISASIVAALGRLGLDARQAGCGRADTTACFASSGGHEILVGERKICGSALRRGRHSYLVHGSLLTGPAQARIAQYLRSSGDAAELRRRSTDLATEGLSPAEIAHLPQLLIEEFRRGFLARQGEEGAGLTSPQLGPMFERP